MGSINAQTYAGKISENIRKGKRVVKGELLREVGYSESVSHKPQLVENTIAFKKAMELERRPLIEGLQREINRIKDAMEKKNLRNEQYRTLIGSLDILTKNYQLLSGGATERQVFVLPSEVMNRNNIVASDDNTIDVVVVGDVIKDEVDIGESNNDISNTGQVNNDMT